MLLEHVGGSVAGKVMPGPVVCLRLNGGFVIEVGDVTVDIVNLPEIAVIVAVGVVVVVVVVVVDVTIADAVPKFVPIIDDDVVTVILVSDEGEDGGFVSEILEVGKDFSSIFSELDISEDDGLEVLEEILLFFSPRLCVFDASLSASMFFPKKIPIRQFEYIFRTCR